MTASGALSLIFASQMVSANLTQTIEDALTFNDKGNSGAIKFDLKYRYENVNQELGPLKTANANTASLRLGYLTPMFHGFQAFAEYEGNLAMQDDYNDLQPPFVGSNPSYSRVVDPERSELNQFWFSYNGIVNTVFKIGRQRVSFDDNRFIAIVPWRQLETTYDAVTITQKDLLPGLIVNVGYLGNAQIMNGFSENMESPLLNLNYKLGDYGNLVGYGYWLDYTERENYEKSNQNYGVRLSCCTKPLDSIKINDQYGVVYTAEYSHQSDYGHGLTAYDVDRYNLMGGFSAFKVMFQGAMEQFGGYGLNRTFDFPLGLNHAFQGWADLFAVSTPANGLRDLFGTVIVPFQNGDLLLTGMYHDYSDDTGRFNYGDEWNFSVLQKWGKHYSVLVKYAYYNAGDNSDALFKSTDTQKFWVQGGISF